MSLVQGLIKLLLLVSLISLPSNTQIITNQFPEQTKDQQITKNQKNNQNKQNKSSNKHLTLNQQQNAQNSKAFQNQKAKAKGFKKVTEIRTSNLLSKNSQYINNQIQIQYSNQQIQPINNTEKQIVLQKTKNKQNQLGLNDIQNQDFNKKIQGFKIRKNQVAAVINPPYSQSILLDAYGTKKNQTKVKIIANTINTTILNTTNTTKIPSPPQKNLTFDFKSLDSDIQNNNQSFKFSRNTTLPQVPPIVLKYPEYIKRFKPTQQKVNPDQTQFRQFVYNGNLQLINAHNQQVRGYNMGLNLFTDVLINQFDRQFSKLQVPENLTKDGLLQQAILKTNNTVSYTAPPRIIIDWSCKASDIVSQGACGASYIIAPLQTITITMRIYNLSASYLSIQEVLSCGNQFSKNITCEGGYFADAYNYVQKFGVGQSLVYYYDETAKFEAGISKCNRSIIENKLYVKNKIYIQKSVKINYGDCQQMIKQLRFRTLSVVISGKDLQFYTDGTFDSSANQISHGVVLMGFHPDKGYLIKNSWGKTWGVAGYGYMSQKTGICNFGMYPIIFKQNGTPNQCTSQV